MILVVPALMTVLLYFTLSLQVVGPDGRTPFDRLGILQLGVLPCAVMFPITAITMRRERSNGTLDRLFATPMTKLELLAGYGTAFSFAAVAQAVIVTLVAFRVTDLHTSGQPTAGGDGLRSRRDSRRLAWAVLQRLRTNRIPGGAVRADRAGAPAVPGWRVHPPRGDAGMAAIDQQRAAAPYAVDALQQVSTHTEATPQMWRDVAVVAVFIVAALLGGAATLRRRTP